MKFSQLDKSDIFQQNYNPGPGHYGNPGSMKPIKQTYVGRSAFNDTFARDSRFKDGRSQSANPGPGWYFGNEEWKPKSSKGQSVLHFLSNPRKVVTIPSIPNNIKGLGYVEREDGFLIPLEDPEKVRDEDEVGPGSYNIKDNWTSKKVVGGTAMKSKLDRFKGKKEEQKENEANIGPGTYNLPTVFDQTEEEENAKKFQKKDRVKPKPPIPLTEAPKPQPKEQTPGPGQYYNPEQMSDFKTEQKPAKLQFFGSSCQRFQYKAPPEIPGPGQYDQFVREKGQLAEPMAKATGRADLKKDNIPGPGHYKNSEKPFAKTDQNFKEFVEYPSAFGSGMQRFQKNFGHPMEQTPGPGHYNVKANKNPKMRKKKYKTYVIPAQVAQNEIDQLSKDKELTQNYLELFTSGNPKGTLPKRSTVQQPQQKNKNSVFASGTQRFQNKNSSTENPGPGSYIGKKSKNFRKEPIIQQNETFARADRQTHHRSDEYQQNLGPGSYDFNLDRVKEKIGRNVKINPEHNLYKKAIF